MDNGAKAIAVIVAVIAGGWFLYATQFHDPKPVAPADTDPYVEFRPGEKINVGAEHNVSCLNRYLPDGLTASARNETDWKQHNFTHKEVWWRTDVVIERQERQRAADPSTIRVHEETIRSCAELQREASDTAYVRELWTDFDQLEEMPCPHALHSYDACYRSPWNSTDRESVIAVNRGMGDTGE